MPGTSSADPAALAQAKANRYNAIRGDLNWADCPKCRNKGQIMVVSEDGSTAIRECGCMGRRRSLRRLERSGLKELVWRCRFDTFRAAEPWQRQARELARKYAQHPDGQWFLLSGQSGSGKTHLCVAICRELMLRGTETYYMLWRDTITRLKASVNDAEQYQAIMEPLKRVPVLYIDDFYKCGKNQEPSAADVNAAFELINDRYMSQAKLTVLSTERSIGELVRIDEAVGSRILERCGEFWAQIDGPDKNLRLKE